MGTLYFRAMLTTLTTSSVHFGRTYRLVKEALRSYGKRTLTTTECGEAG